MDIMRSMMSSLKYVLAVVFSAVIATSAYGATFKGEFSISGPALEGQGLAVHALPQSGDLHFDLEVGEHVTFGLFDIWTNERYVNKDDRYPQALDVAFNFVSPVTDGSVSGAVKGKSFFGIQWGKVTWDNPVIFTFGQTGKFALSLSNEVFNYGWFGLGEGYHRGATVHLTAKYLSPDVAPVPLPAAGLLLIGGLFGLGFVSRRRRVAA